MTTWIALGETAFNHQADAGIDADQAQGAGPEPLSRLASHHLDHLAAHRLTEEAQPDRQQEYPGLGLEVPVQSVVAHEGLQTQFTSVRTP